MHYKHPAVAFSVLFLGAAAALFVLGSYQREDEGELLLDRLQGTWKRQAGNAFTSEVPDRPNVVASYTLLQVEGVSWEETTEVKGQPQDRLSFYIVLDAKREPAALDLVYKFSRPPGRRVARVGVVRVEGDSLTLCFRDGSAPRPWGFDRKAAGSARVWTFKRVK